MARASFSAIEHHETAKDSEPVVRALAARQSQRQHQLVTLHKKWFEPMKNILDQEFEPLATDDGRAQMGLVVRGLKLSEREFEALYGGKQEPGEVLFESEDGTPEPTAPGRDGGE